MTTTVNEIIKNIKEKNERVELLSEKSKKIIVEDIEKTHNFKDCFSKLIKKERGNKYILQIFFINEVKKLSKFLDEYNKDLDNNKKIMLLKNIFVFK